VRNRTSESQYASKRPQEKAIRDRTPVTRIIPRRGQYSKNSTSPTRVGLATLLETVERKVIPSGNERDLASISKAELRTSQAKDDTCSRLLTHQQSRGSLNDLEQEVLLVIVSAADGSRQVALPQALISRVLYLEHYPLFAGHPGARKMLRSVRRAFFWPRIAEDVIDTVR
jgi:hypothetical protein